MKAQISADPTPIPADEYGMSCRVTIRAAATMGGGIHFALAAFIGVGSAGIGASKDFRSHHSPRKA
ncbi:MAG TPA: hypothetical protein VN782_01805 [Usitatibacter sp.]|nr:hypothetical protein [Usitatibacter sp.]